jgi:hypothetical protein
MAQRIIDHVASKRCTSTPEHRVAKLARHVFGPLMMLSTIIR